MELFWSSVKKIIPQKQNRGSKILYVSKFRENCMIFEIILQEKPPVFSFKGNKPPEFYSTWSFDGVVSYTGCHTERVFATVYRYTKRVHRVTHGLTSIYHCGTFPWELGRPHPITTAFHILQKHKQVYSSMIFQNMSKSLFKEYSDLDKALLNFDKSYQHS